MNAILSTDRRYRYVLWRGWNPPLPAAIWVMLNPSTADESTDDPTIRRCLGFSRAWGCGEMQVINLYALRATDPRKLWESSDPVGPLNDYHTTRLLRSAAEFGWPVIAAWGANARAERVKQFLAIADAHGCRIHSLGLTKGGAPRHPLYLPASSAPTLWWPR